MLQITFLALGLSGLLFAIAYFFKKYQRGILWAAVLILFIGTSLMLGLGLIKIVENGEANHLAVFSVILSFACSGIFACGAEKIHEASLKKASLSLSETQGKESHEEATSEQELGEISRFQCKHSGSARILQILHLTLSFFSACISCCCGARM